MKIYNFELQPLYDFLLSLELAGKQNRMRTRFCKLLAEGLIEFEDDKQKLILEYADLDENGEPKVELVDNNKTKFLIKDMVSFKREIDVLLREEYVISETEERKDMLMTVADIVLNLDRVFSGNDAIMYDRFCELFESISYS